jgi:hypothetical protein
MSKTTSPSPHVITANRLNDGLVVYWTEGEAWTEDFPSAAVLFEPSLAVALARAKADEVAGVIGVYAHALKDGAAEHLRDLIRATGPTVAYKTSPSAKAS